MEIYKKRIKCDLCPTVTYSCHNYLQHKVGLGKCHNIKIYEQRTTWNIVGIMKDMSFMLHL